MTMPSGYRFVLVGVILAYLAVNLIVGLWAGKMEKSRPPADSSVTTSSADAPWAALCWP